MRKLNSRTIHRYLSIFVGVQLILWAASGLVFCWLPIDQVTGKHLIAVPRMVDLGRYQLLDLRELVSTATSRQKPGCEIRRAELRMLNDQPIYELESQVGQSPQFRIFDARTGEQLSPIGKESAIQIALADFGLATEVASAELVETVSPHSEYREKELPAWRVSLKHESGTVIYVSANRGLVTARRNSQWRLFDFFWMLHTMDYQGRDNFNTWLLLVATVLATLSMVSGYWLWWRSSRIRNRWKRRKANIARLKNGSAQGS